MASRRQPRTRRRRDERADQPGKLPERRLRPGHQPAPRPTQQHEPETRTTGHVRR